MNSAGCFWRLGSGLETAAIPAMGHCTAAPAAAPMPSERRKFLRDLIIRIPLSILELLRKYRHPEDKTKPESLVQARSLEAQLVALLPAVFVSQCCCGGFASRAAGCLLQRLPPVSDLDRDL